MSEDFIPLSARLREAISAYGRGIHELGRIDGATAKISRYTVLTAQERFEHARAEVRALLREVAELGDEPSDEPSDELSDELTM